MIGRWWNFPFSRDDKQDRPTSCVEPSIDGLWRISTWSIAVTALALGSFAALERVAADNPQPPDITRSASAFVAGQTQRGAQIASSICAGCHGDGKTEPRPGVPNLAGQKTDVLFKQLNDFRNGDRLHTQMEAVAKALEISDLATVAAFYTSQPRPGAPGELKAAPEIERLAREGDKVRELPACMACHEGRATDPTYAPVLAGQSETYLLAQLDAFAAGRRMNDVSGLMRKFAGKLSSSERAAMAHYFHGDASRTRAGSSGKPKPTAD